MTANASTGGFRNDRPAPAAGPTLAGPPEIVTPRINPWIVAGVVTSSRLT